MSNPNKSLQPGGHDNSGEPLGYDKYVSPSEAIAIEARRRSYNKSVGESSQLLGAIDAKLAAQSSMIVGTVGEGVQTEREGMLRTMQELQARFPNASHAEIVDMLPLDPTQINHHLNPLELLSHSPLDNKALGVAIATYGLASVARRYSRDVGTKQAVNQAIDDIRTLRALGAEYIPWQADQLKRRNMTRRGVEAVATTVAVVGSYNVAEHGTIGQDAFTTLALSAAAVGSMAVASVRDHRGSRGGRSRSNAAVPK
jgi:hypothetical protein